MIDGPLKDSSVPAWMESLESIHRTAEPARRGLPGLLKRRDGHAVTQSSCGNLVQDLTGSTYLRFESEQKVGSVAARSFQCRLNREGNGDLEYLRFRILRVARRAEVKKIWEKCPHDPKAPLPSSGYWYEVHTD